MIFYLTKGIDYYPSDALLFRYSKPLENDVGGTCTFISKIKDRNYFSVPVEDAWWTLKFWLNGSKLRVSRDWDVERDPKIIQALGF